MEEFEAESCLFCTNRFDRKPDINYEGGESFENFKRGFNLFCKLLGVDVNCEGGLGNDNVGEKEPCCDECLEALGNVVKLEKIIVETRERQIEVVQLLRAVTVATDSVQVGLRWVQLRECLVKALQPEVDCEQSSIHSNYDDYYMDEGADNFDEEGQSPPQIKNCNVSLTRISLPLKHPGRDPFAASAIKPELGGDIHFENIQMDDSTASETIKRRGRGRPRGSRTLSRKIEYKGRPRGSVKRKWEADMADINLGEADPTWKPGSSSRRGQSKPTKRRILMVATKQIQPQPILKRPKGRPRGQGKKKEIFMEIECGPSLDEEEKIGQPTSDKIKINYNTNVTKLFKRQLGKCRELELYCHQSPSDDLFLRLRDDLFFHKNMLVAFTQKKLVCQEKDCNYKTSCEDNCVSYELFEEFRNHVNESHKFVSRHLTQTCPLCSKTFEKQPRYVFKRHLMEEHLPPVICNSCWQPFYDKGVRASEMMRHVWSHKNEEEKEFAKALGYQDWERKKKAKVVKETMTREPGVPPELNIFCDQCPRRFATEGGLKSHLKTHFLERLGKTKKTGTDFRKLECRFCGQQFPVRQRHQFERHMESHSDNLSFICETCGKGFVSQFKLNVHANVHSEEPQFQCEFCERKYKHPRNLHLHKQKEHGDILEVIGKGKRKEFIGPKIAFPCDFCDRIFPYRGPWANHVKKEHADKQGMNDLKVEGK